MATSRSSCRSPPQYQPMLPPDPVFVIRGGMQGVTCLSFPSTRFSIHSNFLLAGTNDGQVHLWDLETNRRVMQQQIGESLLNVHSLDHDLITQERNGTISYWHNNNINYVKMMSTETHGGFCKSIIVNNEIILPQDKTVVQALDATNMRKTRIMHPRIEGTGAIMSLDKVTIGGKDYVLGAYEAGHLVLWDLSTALPISHIKLRNETICAKFDQMKNMGMAGNSSNKFPIFHIDRYTLQFSIKGEPMMTNGGVTALTTRGDGRIFVAACGDNKLRYFSWRSLKVLAVLPEHTKPILDIKFSPLLVDIWNTKVLAAGSLDGTISLWNPYSD